MLNPKNVLQHCADVILYLLLVVFTIQQVIGQDRYQFTHLTSEDGLLDDIAYSIMQDSKGYIWIGTMAGLQRYDGYDFLNFKYNPINPKDGLKESVVRHIMEASDGTIWIGTQGGGVARYKDGTLMSGFQHDPNTQNGISGNFVECIIEDNEGKIWIATNNGLDVYENGSFSHFYNEPKNPNSLSHSSVFSIFQDSRKNIWIGTQDGLNIYQGKGRFVRYYHDPKDINSISGNFIHDILEDDNGNIWLAVVQGGVNRINVNDMKVTRFMHEAGNPKSLGNNIALNLAKGMDNKIWAATWGGGLSSIHKNEVTVYRFDPQNPSSILSDNVEEVIVDNVGNIWTANYLGSVNRFAEKEVISYSYKNLKDDGMLPTGNLRAVIETRDQAVWIATHSGVNRFKDGKFTQYLHNEKNPTSPTGLSSPRANTLLEDRNGHIWIGNHGAGMDVIQKDQIKHFIYNKNDPNSIPNDEVNVIVEDIYGVIWIGFLQAGIASFSNGQFTSYRHNPNNPRSIGSDRVLDLFASKDGAVWIATGNGGLSRFKDGAFTNYLNEPENPTSLPKNVLKTVAVDFENRVWVGYTGGVSVLNQNTQEFKAYTEENGLAGTVVEDINIDANGGVWLATHNGASKYLPDVDQFETYNKKNGFTDNKLINVFGSKYTEKIFFGGPDGFSYYDIKSQKSNLSDPKLTFTDFTISGDYPDSIKNKFRPALLKNEPIKLKYNQNSFEIKFSALSSDIKPSFNYAYRIKNLDERWTFIGNTPKISFTYLEPGEHLFELKLIIPGGEEIIKFQNIEIMPPWWKTVWFQLMLTLTTLSIIGAVVGLRRKQIKEARKMLELKISDATIHIQEQNQALQNQQNNLQNAIEETHFVISEAAHSGNFSARINLEGKTGEWRALGESINQLFESVIAPFNAFNEVVSHLADGDLTQRFSAEAKGDVLILAENLNHSLDKMENLLGEIAVQAKKIGESSFEMMSNSEEMNNSTGEIASAIAEMSKGAQNQVVKVDEASNLVEEIMSFSTNMGGQAELINQTATNGVKYSAKGAKLINRVENTMKEIIEYSSATNNAITGLKQRSNEISRVLRIIKDIATQTNLLALNAAIEAAQAGDAGRGFAVVASEIRKLAEISKNSTKEIEQMISAIQDDTHVTAQLIKEMDESVKGGEDATQFATLAFEEIATSYKQTLELSEKIVSATKQQTQFISNILNITESVVVIAEQTAAGTEEMASSSAELSAGMINFTDKTKEVSAIADDLGQKVNRFKLTDQ